MSRRSSVESLEYTRLTLQLIERLPRPAEDAELAAELKFFLQGRIAELERETARPLPLTQTVPSPARSSECNRHLSAWCPVILRQHVKSA
jgi:hypothetical protein